MSDETNIVDTTEAEMDALGKDNYALRRENAELRERLKKIAELLDGWRRFGGDPLLAHHIATVTKEIGCAE